MQPRYGEIDTGPDLDLGETEFSSIVGAGRGRYVGVLKGIPDKMESVVLFNSPHTATTLGLPISRLTAAAVREHLAESDAAFSGAFCKMTNASAVGIIFEHRFHNFQRILARWISDHNSPSAPKGSPKSYVTNFGTIRRLK